MEILAFQKDGGLNENQYIFYYIPKINALASIFHIAVTWRNDTLTKIIFIYPLETVDKDSALETYDKLAPISHYFDLYFQGKTPTVHPIIQEFHILDQIHSDFSRKLYEQAIAIPFGNQLSYGDIAHRLHSKAYQAVGTALKKNPFPLIIPCHRIV